MRKLNNDDDVGSIAPLVTFLLVIFIFGLMWGIFNIMMEAVYDVDSTMSLMMWRAWVILGVVVFIVMVAWLLKEGQKSRFLRY